MKVKEFFSNLIHERAFRWYILAGVSFIVSLAFAAYNFTVGVTFRLVWNFSVSFYYICLVIIKAIILYRERKWKALPQERISQKRLALFKLENVFLLVIDLLLIAPITLMILQEKRTADMGMIPAIAVAAYTTYKIIMACVNYTRSKKDDNITLYGLKIISLKEAIVSIITLQNTMVVVFGNAADMQTLTTWTTAGMFLSLVGISIFQFIKLRKLKND